MKPRFIKLTIAEPFPVFFSDPRFPTECHKETAVGPFYSAGSEWFYPDNEKNRRFAEFQSSRLQSAGFTASTFFNIPASV